MARFFPPRTPVVQSGLVRDDEEKQSAMALAPGPNTFSIERLRQIWRRDQPPQEQMDLMEYQRYRHNMDNKLADPQAAKQLCMSLFTSVQDPSKHISRLDATFESFFLRPFPQSKLAEKSVSLVFAVLVNMSVYRLGNVDLLLLQ